MTTPLRSVLFRRSFMAVSDQVGPIQEYQTLRQELLESKRYVFERPLLIATAGLASLGAVKGGYVAAIVPPFMSIVLLFNFWFTVNRLHSAARIIAYIQLELEERNFGPWKGWETCLREYRKWLKDQNAEALVDSKVDKEAVPDALMYYPAIYLLHLGIASLAAISSSVLAILDRNWLTISCLAASLLLTIWFLKSALDHQPRLMRTRIERNRVIWEYVLAKMSSNPKLHRTETAP
jgi:hypothetical protein